MTFAPAHHSPAIGIDLGGTKIEGLLLDSQGQERWRKRVATPQGDYRGTLAAVASLVAQARAQPGAAHATVGIALPGTPTAGGWLKNANSVCLNGQPVQTDLQDLLNGPVIIANDANCLALSEATDGAAAGATVVFAVILGTGIGGGWAVRGHVLTGPHGLAGEWGHNPMPGLTAQAPSLSCYCGQRGCIESWVSGPALSADHVRHGGAALTAQDLSRLAGSGDGPAQASLNRWCTRLAQSLAQVINLMDPDVIVLGGGLSRIASVYESVPRQWGAWVFGACPQEPVRTRLLPAQHGDSSGVRGAAWLGRQARATSA